MDTTSIPVHTSSFSPVVGVPDLTRDAHSLGQVRLEKHMCR